MILCVVFKGEMKATAVTLGRVLPTLLNLKFSPFEFNHLLCSSRTGNHVEIHPTPNKCKYPQAVTHTCTVCLILTGMHPYVLRQLLQVEMPHGQILCHHSCTGCLNGGVTHSDLTHSDLDHLCHDLILNWMMFSKHIVSVQ